MPILFARCPFCGKHPEVGKVYLVEVTCEDQVDEDLVKISEDDTFTLLASKKRNWEKEFSDEQTVTETYNEALEKLDQGSFRFTEVKPLDYALFIGWVYISPEFSRMIEQVGGMKQPLKI